MSGRIVELVLYFVAVGSLALLLRFSINKYFSVLIEHCNAIIGVLLLVSYILLIVFPVLFSGVDTSVDINVYHKENHVKLLAMYVNPFFSVIAYIFSTVMVNAVFAF